MTLIDGFLLAVTDRIQFSDYPIMTMDLASQTPVNHVFVDIENVMRIEPGVIGGKNLRLYLFLGPNNKKLDVSVVEKLLEHSQTVQMVRSPKSGKNALDFVLAYYLGQAVLEDPKGYFHIVSKDTGFDALVELLKSKNAKVKRHEGWSALNLGPHAKAPITGSQLTEAERMLENLRKNPKGRPKKLKSLIAHAMNFTGKDKPQAQAEKLVNELTKDGHVVIDEKGAVVYKLLAGDLFVTN